MNDRSRPRSSTNTKTSRLEVAVPTDYNLDYDSLDLETPDGVTLRCYLLVQHKDLGANKVGATHIDEDVDPDLSDEDVRRRVSPLVADLWQGFAHDDADVPLISSAFANIATY